MKACTILVSASLVAMFAVTCSAIVQNTGGSGEMGAGPGGEANGAGSSAPTRSVEEMPSASGASASSVQSKPHRAKPSQARKAAHDATNAHDAPASSD